MSQAKTFIITEFPQLDEDSTEYVLSLAGDHSLQQDEKVSIISEFISGAIDRACNESIVSKLIEFADLDRIELSNHRHTRSLLTEKAVMDCISVIRAPVVDLHATPPSPEIDDVDLLRKKELLKMYDPDSVAAPKKANFAPVEEEEEIYGLGANENKLRKIREREEQRMNAKQEQEEAKQLRVQEKLKKQGELIKGKTVVRSAKR